MIGELRLKVDGMQKELMVQSKRLEEGTRFKDQFHSDLRAAVQVSTQLELVNRSTQLIDYID